MKLTIDRRTWHRGKGAQGSALLLENGHRCCLGFLGQACGLEDHILFGQPDYVSALQDHPLSDFSKLPSSLLETNRSNSSYERGQWWLASVNDNQGYSDAERESILTRRFADHGVEVEFVN